MKHILFRALFMLGPVFMTAVFASCGLFLAPLAAAIGGPILALVVWVWCALGALCYLALAWVLPLKGPRTPAVLTASGGGVLSYLVARRLRLFESPR